jgi:glycosyltransferase involved in cell wall biosynthesis
MLPIGRKNLAGFLALRRWLKTNNLDVLNTHSSTDSWLSALACATLKHPPHIVRTRHISAPTPDNLPTRWLYTKATQLIVTTGETLRRELVERNRYPAAMITSVPTGIDPVRFAPGDKLGARKALGLTPNHHYIGIVATLRSWKGHRYLLEAFAAMNRTDWCLIVVGDGPQLEALEKQVRELNISELVRFTGHCTNPEDWLRALDIFCLPSYANEGVPQALVQAMLTALPIITTPVGSILEIVTNNESALIVEPKTPKAILDALQRLIEKPQEAKELGLHARAFALQHLTRDAMLNRMETIFSRLVA